MKRNKLYTVNKWNQPAFMPKQEGKNLFSDGSQMDNTGDLKEQYYGSGSSSTGSSSGGGSSSGSIFGGFGASFGDAFKGATGGFGGISGLGSSLGSAIGGGISSIGSAVGGAVGNLIGGGYESGVGNALGSLGKVASVIPGPWGAAISGGLQVLGGGVNALFGSKVDEKALREANENTAKLNSFKSNATSLDDIKGPESVKGIGQVYKGGLFVSGAAEEKNRQLRNRLADAISFADRSVGNNIFNLTDDQMNSALANYAAYGGPMDFGGGALGLMQQNRYFDTIDKRSDALAKNNTAPILSAKTFADGGLAASFMDEFGTDPIAAAVRYNQGLEREAAEREAAQAEAAREAEYAAMQKRIAGLETQNQGLQALMAAMPQTTTTTELPEAPEAQVSSSPSPAAYNSTWTYIEDQLRRSGKFNDTQIQGIKYNLQRESSIDPTVVGDGGSAFGLGQWHGDRKPQDMSLDGQTRHLIDTLSNYDGKLHWIGRQNYEGFMNARTPEEAHYWIARGYERPRQSIVDKVKRDSDMSLRRLNAFGGELGTNCTDFTNGLLYIDEGGTHEENPLDGVPMGLDPEGVPNLVEEGETVYNDYVFSDRMQVPVFMNKELGLPTSKKPISFADASKKLAQESEQRPNDPISQAGLQASLAKLAEVQETERARKNMEEYVGLEYACGGKMGKKYDLGGAMNWLKQRYPSMDDKSVKAVASALNKYIEGNKSSFYKTNGLSGGLNYDIDYGLAFDRLNNDGEKGFNAWVENGLDRRAAFQLTHPMPNKPKNQDLMTEYNKQMKAREEAWGRLVGNAGRQQSSDTPRQQTSVKRQAQSSARKAETATQTPLTVGAGTNKSYSLASAQQTASPQASAITSTPAATTQGSSRRAGNRRVSSDRSSNYDYGNSTTIPAPITGGNPYPTSAPYPPSPSSTPRGAETQGIGYMAADAGVTNQEAAEMGLEQAAQKAIQQTTERTPQQEDVPQYATWMRYAPAFGAGIMSLTDALGLTNNPDYTYADRLEAAANAAGYAPHIEAEPIGNYLTYNPMDIWYEQNALNAQSRATDRALLNSSSPSKAAGLLANGYNSQLASGNLYRQALEYNDAKRQAVEDFNRRTNMFNSQMKLEADMANARYHQQAQQFGLSGLAQAAALRDQIDARTGAAKAANLSNFFTSLGNIGRENFAMNQINNDRSRRYYGTLTGKSGYKQAGAAYGGKIKKCK